MKFILIFASLPVSESCLLRVYKWEFSILLFHSTFVAWPYLIIKLSKTTSFILLFIRISEPPFSSSLTKTGRASPLSSLKLLIESSPKFYILYISPIQLVFCWQAFRILFLAYLRSLGFEKCRFMDGISILLSDTIALDRAEFNSSWKFQGIGI